jgi:flagellin
MALRIFNNISSLNTQRVLELNRSRLGRSISRVASGQRITRSADDSAGLAISQSLRSDVATLKQGARNLTDGIAMINAADGSLTVQAGILIRARELASQAATGTIGQTERETINLEFNALLSELNRIGSTAEFNGQKLIDGSLSSAASETVILQIGNSSADDNRINLNKEMNLTAVTTDGLNIDGLSALTQRDAVNAMGALTRAVDELNLIRGRVGTVQNRSVRALNNINVSIVGLTSAVATINDTDVAAELADLTKTQILVQAGAAMVGQSNIAPQAVLSLL